MMVYVCSTCEAEVDVEDATVSVHGVEVEVEFDCPAGHFNAFCE